MEEDHRFERRAKRAAEHGEKEEAEEEHGEEEEKSEETPAEEPENEQATGKDNLEASGAAEAGDDATVILMLKGADVRKIQPDRQVYRMLRVCPLGYVADW
jgi:hypothetical protein